MLSLGSFPSVTLLEARKKRTELREQIAAGIDPSLKKRMDRQAVVLPRTRSARSLYLANLQKNGMAAQTISKNTWLLTVLAEHPFGSGRIADVKPAEVLDVLRKVETSGRRDTAHRLRSVIGSVLLARRSIDAGNNRVSRRHEHLRATDLDRVIGRRARYSITCRRCLRPSLRNARFFRKGASGASKTPLESSQRLTCVGGSRFSYLQCRASHMRMERSLSDSGGGSIWHDI
jgi:hypothetical protein